MLFIKCKSFCNVSCWHLELGQSTACHPLRPVPMCADNAGQWCANCAQLGRGRTERVCELEICGCHVSHSELWDVAGFGGGDRLETEGL